MSRLALSAVLICALAVPRVGAAATCADVVARVGRGEPVAEIVALLRRDGRMDEATVQCLVDARVPAEVVAAARSLVPRPQKDVAPEPIPELAASAVEEAPAPPPPVRAKEATGRPAPAKSVADRAYAPSMPARPLVGGEPQANTESYEDYGVNGTVLVERDALSTFGIDVDTASYTISRAKLTGGALPPAAAVRVEEFVNYFPYDDAPPTRGDAPFAVHLEAAPHPQDPHEVLLRVGVKGKELEGERPPVHLTFLVDTSGSMSAEDKLPLARRALHELVDNLGEEDTVALATYAGSTTKVLGPTPTTRKSTIHAAIDQLSSGGGTAMSSGVDLAYDMAREAFLKGAENRVIVLSDGDANIGPSSHEEILRTIEGYAEEGITLTTVGFGMGNYQDTMMEQLADKGDGNYYYIDDFAEARRVFGVNLSGTIELIAKDVKIQVAFDPDVVRAYRLIGYENRDIADRDFRNDAVDAGELGSGHTVTALYQLTLADDTPEGPLATVHLRAMRPGPDTAAREWTTALDAGRVASTWSSASPDLRVAYAVATFAEKLRASPHAEEVRYADLWREVQGAGRGYPEDVELLGLIDAASRLSGEGAIARR